MTSLLLRCQECRAGFQEAKPYGWPIWCAACEGRILGAMASAMTPAQDARIEVEVTPCGDRFGLRYDGEIVGVMWPVPVVPVPNGKRPIQWVVSAGGGHQVKVERARAAMHWAVALHVWRKANPQEVTP